METKKIAITGASGYIGQMLVERLAKAPGIKILALDLVKPGRLPPGVEFAPCDVRDPAITRRFQGCDVVVHLAFIVAAIHDREAIYDINTRGSRNVLNACEEAGVGKLVVASSVAAYGRQPRDNRRITEDTPRRGDSASYYLHTKRLLEEDLDLFEKRNPKIVLTRIRPSILLGKNNRNFVHELARFPRVPKVREGLYLPVVHEEDVIDAFELAVMKDAPGPFIISLPEPTSMEDMARALDKDTISMSRAQLLFLSRLGFKLHLTLFSPDWIVSGDTQWRFDISRAKNVLGWEPKHDLPSTIQEMADTIRKNWWLNRLRERLGIQG